MDGNWNFLDSINGMTPEEVFASFDEDGDGKIGYDEFLGVLKELGINIADAKALKCFRKIAANRSLAIDINEFRIALFALDPESGSFRGVSPNTLLTPMEAFAMFDKDSSGSIDGDELFFALQHLGIKVSEKEHEKIFKKYDKDRDGLIGYEEFMKIWLALGNMKEELANRGVKVNPFLSNAKLGSMLDKVLRDVEKLENEAIEEAIAWGRMQSHLNGIKEAYKLARHRASQELSTALDAGGAVFLIGTGAFEEFTGEAPESVEIGGFPREKWSTVRELWSSRVSCISNEPRVSSSECDDYSSGHDTCSKPCLSGRMNIACRDFQGLVIAKSTAVLWGRRVTQAALSSASAIALTDLGELFAWGGSHKKWWHGSDLKSLHSEDYKKHGNKPGPLISSHQLSNKTINKATSSSTTNYGASATNIPPIDPEDTEIQKFKCLLEYYNLWTPLPDINRLRSIRIELLPKIQMPLNLAWNVVVLFPEEKNKEELLNVLYEALVLEKNVMGINFHRRICQLEFDINAYKKRKRFEKSKPIRLDIEQMWYPLREIQAEDAAKSKATADQNATESYYQCEMQYLAYRKDLQEARSNATSMRTLGGINRVIEVSGLDHCGNGSNAMNLGSSCSFIAAGESHMFSIHSSGELYCWGPGLSGRLGLDSTINGMPQKSIEKPTLVQALRGQLVVQVPAGRNHSAVVTVGGRLYTWGSAAHGKLGMGECGTDSYTATPGKVPLGFGNDFKVASISCGAAHSATTTTCGQLFIWGCGDGGRLGLGPGHTSTVWKPMLVDNLSQVKIASVSCGTTHTIALEAISTLHSGEMRNINNNSERNGRNHTVRRRSRGGRVFQAGSASVLGIYLPTFTCILELEGLNVCQVSAGHAHSAAITTDGELYCWGSNKGWCCGQPLTARFVPAPKCVSGLFQHPQNLALRKTAQQSSVYNERTADIAVDGNQVEVGGLARYCCTQQEPQAWWEVDLGMIADISEIHVWDLNDQFSMDSNLDSKTCQSRLFPFWIMVSNVPYDTGIGESSLRKACNKSTVRKRVTEQQQRQCSRWICPKFTRGRYVRIQSEGFGWLSLSQVEIMGRSNTSITSGGGGRVGSVTCGLFATLALVKPWNDPHDVEIAYKRAVQADSESAEALRQLDTFVSYDKHGRGDSLHMCLLCHGKDACEICMFKGMNVQQLMTLPLGPGGRLRRLDSMRDFIYKAAIDKGGEDELDDYDNGSFCNSMSSEKQEQ